MNRPITIAIDGPAGSGKSSVSQRLAERFHYLFVDTGSFYRAITYILLQARVDLNDLEMVENIVRRVRLEIQEGEAASCRIISNGEDITDQLRSKQVEDHVSAVSSMPLIRTLLLPLQQEVAKQGNIIMAGRDIGTVVLPDANLKIYIDASLEERARRRYDQLHASGKAVALDAIAEGIAQRDKADSERSVAPLRQAENAIYIDTDSHSLDEVVEQISRLIENGNKT